MASCSIAVDHEGVGEITFSCSDSVPPYEAACTPLKHLEAEDIWRTKIEQDDFMRGTMFVNGKNSSIHTGTCWFLLRGCVNTELFEHRFSVWFDDDCMQLHCESGVGCFHCSYRIDPSPSAHATLKGMTADLRQSTRMQEECLLYLAEHVHLIEILS